MPESAPDPLRKPTVRQLDGVLVKLDEDASWLVIIVRVPLHARVHAHQLIMAHDQGYTQVW
jgi:hypothetical protein